MPKQKEQPEQNSAMELQQAVRPLRTLVLKNAARTFDAAAVRPPKRQAEVLISGYTKLSAACMDGELGKAVRLLQEGCDPNQREDDGAGPSPLENAVLGGHHDLALLMVKAGAQVSHKALEYSVSYPRPDDNGQRFDLILLSAPKEQLQGLTGLESFLMCAAHKGDIALARALLDAGANPNRNAGYTNLFGDISIPAGNPADHAFARGHGFVARMLTQGGPKTPRFGM